MDAALAPYTKAVNEAKAEFMRTVTGSAVGKLGANVAFAGGAAAFAELQKAQNGLKGMASSGS